MDARIVPLAVVLLAALGAADGRTRQQGAPRPDQAGGFDYYVLSLSWSPTYCERHAADTQQCGAQRPGFVLHGLWPQYQAGGFPQSCASGALDDEARRAGARVFPTETLVAHEWTKHGTCSGLDAKTYFERAGQARDGIRIPEQLQPGTRTASLRAQEVTRMLRDANPALTARSLAVVCAQRELAEVRVCLDKDLQPRNCGNDVHSSCPAGPVRITGVR